MKSLSDPDGAADGSAIDAAVAVSMKFQEARDIAFKAGIVAGGVMMFREGYASFAARAGRAGKATVAKAQSIIWRTLSRSEGNSNDMA